MIYNLLIYNQSWFIIYVMKDLKIIGEKYDKYFCVDFLILMSLYD